MPKPSTRPPRQAAPTKPWLIVPPTWPGSGAEYAIYWGHIRLGLREGIEFTYQSPFQGGRLFKGGAIIDFFENDLNIAVRVQGRHWHVYASGDVRALDLIQKLSMESQGIIVVDIDEQVALRVPIEAVKTARQGREIIVTY